MESETEENPDDQDYILSILRNLQSPNRFATGNPINNCASVISGNVYSDEDSNTNDSSSNFSTNGELSDEQLVENFNRVRTGHRLDDYILSILNNGKCQKKSHIQSTVDSLESIHCSDLTLKPFENAFSPGSLEVSNILFKEDSSNHKLDEVLHVAMKIVKPKNGKTTKSSNVFSPCKGKSLKSNCTKMKKQTTHSASNLTCHVCNFVFNSEKSRNRHMSNEHIKRVSNKNQCGNRKRNLSQSENFPSETSNCSTTTWCFYAFPQEEEHEKKRKRENFEKEQLSMVNLKKLSIYKTMIDPNTIGETKDVEKGEGSLRTSSCRQVLNSSEDRCSRTQPFSEHVKMKHKQYKNDERYCIETGTCLSELPNKPQFDRLVCDSDFKISFPKHKTDSRPSSLLSKLCSSIQILDKSEPSSSSLSPLSSSSLSSSSSFKLLSNKQSSSTLSSNQQPPSTSNPASPAVLIPDSVLRERHWIILDTPNIFCAPSSRSTTIKVKGHQNQTQNDDIVGIKSILDEPVKAPSVTQCLTLFPECSSRSATQKSNTKNECSANSIINQVHNFPFVEKSDSQSENCTVNVPATQESDHIENDELEIIKHSCARHLAFSDFIARYSAFKTHRAGNSSSKEDKISTPKDTSKEAVYYSPSSRDFILSPPKKRWKSYLGNE